ncbi:Importin subunit beta-2 [Ceratocystis lukuohia]|uniref:Importin subunit beta-2 n=2 Tax=Ceratocystis TaxID=5157 RepID=A0A2C5WX77_9PEZI|nr:Importin subunit beta-2 [Ceratocystis fimbriata CBS 114723]
MSSWEPNPESLGQLAQYLKNSLSGFNRELQSQAEKMLKNAMTSPDFNNYLAFIFSSPETPPGTNLSAEEFFTVRSAAAIMIKNNIRTSHATIPESSLSFIKVSVQMGLQDKNTLIRNYAGNIATEYVRRMGLFSWPELIPMLLGIALNEGGTTQFSNEAQEGAMSALAKICEDNTKALEREHGGERPVNVLLPKLIQATKSPLTKVRVGALTAINEFVPRKTQAMLNCIDELLSQLFALSSDQSVDVRRQVCHAFVLLIDARPDKLHPHISGLVEYIISQQQSDDEELACEAAEFWLAIGEHDHLWQALTPYIDKIIPVLLECMVYSPEDIAILGGGDDDEEEEDREEDIKPVFAKKSQARNMTEGGEGAAATHAYEKLASMDAGNDDLEDGEIEDDEFGGDDDPEERWTLRKGSAAALDVFARDFRDPVFSCILPYLTTNLKHEEWPHREAAVLALGAIAEGCIDVVTPHLPELVTYLLSLLNDTEPVVRQITCWTLSRFSGWACNASDPNSCSEYFLPLMEGLMGRMLDRNKRVQEAGASAFANLEEKAGRKLEPYCEPIIQQLIRCFGKYKNRNMTILYDCVQTLAESVGPHLAQPHLVNQLMPTLITRYQLIPDDSRELFPLLQCLSYVAMALGDAFANYSQHIFGRCVNIIHTNLEQNANSNTDADAIKPEKDFLITSLDLLSAIIQAIEGNKAAELVAQDERHFFELLTMCMEDSADEVRQSAYALLGDAAKFIFPQLSKYMGSIMPILIRQLDLDNIVDEDIDNGFNVINNACWSVGEIALQLGGPDMMVFMKTLVPALVEIITNPRIPPNVAENACVALGRLGIKNSDSLAPSLSVFAEDFLATMEGVVAADERASAFTGFSLIVLKNPKAMESTLLDFFSVIARYQDLQLQSPVKQEVHDSFASVINVYQQMIPQFNEFLSQLKPNERQNLRTGYGV